MKKTSVELELAGKKLILSTGELAGQATSSILARLGDTMVLVTVVEGKKREDIDYFPLTVEYLERLYAGGKIKGSRWVKREGRPSDESILIARLIDRSIRPLFPKEYKKEVQIVITVLSVDGENEPDILSIIATSAALAISPIPWKGPIAAVRVGMVKEKDKQTGEFLINPGKAESEFSELDLIVSQTKEKTLMIEAGAMQISEQPVLEGIKQAHIHTGQIIKLIEDLTAKVGQTKHQVSPDVKLSELIKKLEKSYKQEIIGLIKTRVSKESGGGSDDLVKDIIEHEKMSDPENVPDAKLVATAIEKILFKAIRDNVLTKSQRPDGRAVDEIRPISVSVSILPRTHGSAIFQRGDTQALTVVTLGSPKLEQLIESAGGEEAKTYIHHYSMPPYSVGETGRMGTPSRREIGHGALAERALLAVIPKQDIFPYTIRVVSEILSSNGSTSMASTCGSTLALMDAGVPIKNLVAGIAVGMMSNDSKYVLLTDILGLEDFSGDMDFKVAGTKEGITAIQLDVKISGLTLEQISETFDRAKKAREAILEKMISVMPQSRTAVSTYAPKIEMIHIPVEKIGEVIGPGGKTIKNIIAQTGATVDVEDDGSVAISSPTEEAVAKASEWIKGLTREIMVGELFDGEVKRILPFGAFVELLPGKEGMVHVSQMSEGFVKDPNQVVQIGQKVQVKVIEIDEQRRINLTMLLSGTKETKPRSSNRPVAPGLRYKEHPLSMQFKRERGSTWRGRSSGGFKKPSPGFRKSSY